MSDSFEKGVESFQFRRARTWDDAWDDTDFVPAPRESRPNDRAMAMVIPGVTLKGAPIKKDDYENEGEFDNCPRFETDLDECLPVPGFQITIGLRALSCLTKKKRELYIDGEVGHKDAPECMGTRVRRKALEPVARLAI